MAPPKPAGHPVPAQAAPPDGFMEYLTLLVQNGSFPPLPTDQSLPIASPASTPTPPVQGRSFTRPGRGIGGELAEKQKVSMQITTPATKRKCLVDPDIETRETVEGTRTGRAKRPKPTLKTKGAGQQPPKVSPLKLPQGSAYTTPTPDPPARPERLPNPISTPTPSTPVLPVSRLKKSRVKVESPQPTTPDVPSVSNDDDNDAGFQDDGGNGENIDSDSDVEIIAQTSNHGMSTSTQSQNPVFTGPPINLLQAYLAQIGGPYIPVQQVQSPAATKPQKNQATASKGIKSYPDGWREVLISAKVIMRSSILLKDPFPAPGQARISANECFHEALTTECQKGLVLEFGFSWSDQMMAILLNEVSTCRGELKKLAKILVGSDPELFPPLESHEQPVQGKAAPKIRANAARSTKQSIESHPFYDPEHIQTSVKSRLADYAFLNDPPTTTGDLLANPILEKLCRSFYEEEKWQRALLVDMNGDSEWLSSVTVVMVAFAATAYRNALEEWRSGRLIPKPFEMEKFAGTYANIRDYIADCLVNGPQTEQVIDRFRAWAEESAFVQELYDETGGDE